MKPSIREELRAMLAGAQPGAYTYEAIALDGAIADVTITVRRTAGDGLAELRADVAKYLQAHPSHAKECHCDNAGKYVPFSSSRRGSRCSRTPTIAVEHSGRAPGDVSWFSFLFVCAAHASRFLDRRTVSVRPELLKEARREAERRAEAARIAELPAEHERGEHDGPWWDRRCPACVEARKAPPTPTGPPQLRIVRGANGGAS